MLQLKKFPDIPVSTREEARESRPHPQEPRLRLLAREERSFPCMVGKEFPAFPSHLKRRHSPQERGEEIQRRSTFPETPDVSGYFRETCFPCTASTFKPRIDSHHSDTWGSPVGKPRGKASRESHGSLDPREGKHDTAATAREKSARACPHSSRGLTALRDSRSTPRSMSALERNPQVPASTPHKVLGPGIDGRGIPRGPRVTSMGTGLS